jgi:hypothetical protein
VTSLDAIIDKVCEMARADFAFVLTRRGRLATRNAPADMPESGRMAIVALAERQLRDKPGTVSHADVPREMLVPFGGAAPVDVYLAAREEAILCVVLATFAEHRYVADAMEAGARELDKLLQAEAERRARRRPAKGAKEREVPKPGKSSPGARRRLSAPPPPPSEPALGPIFRNTIPEGLTAVKITEAAGPVDVLEDMPTITIAPTHMGRATLAAIEVDRDGPEITYGQSTIGRATLSEIELSLVPKGDPRSSIPDIRVDVVSLPAIDTGELDVTDRTTLPFTERPEEAKRRFELAQKLSEGRPVVLEATKTRTVIAGKSKPSPKLRPPSIRPPKGSSQGVPPKIPAPRLPLESRDSNIEIWHNALAETLEEPPREPAPPVRAPAADKTRRSQPPKAAVQWSRRSEVEASRGPESSPPPRSTNKSTGWSTGPPPKPYAKRKPLPPVTSVKRPSDKPKR